MSNRPSAAALTQARSRSLSASSNRLHLLYHELRELPSDYTYALQKTSFEQHADFFVSARDQGNTTLWPEITFDDGHISNHDLALPILAARGLQATFFITVGWTGARAGYMGWEHLRALRDAGQRIGAHGWTHALLPHCDAPALRRELVDARMTLEDKLRMPVTAISLPGGRFNQRVLEACTAAGYTSVFSSIPKAEPPGSTGLVGRLNIRSTATVEWLARLLDPGTGVLRKLERQDRWKKALKQAVGDRAYAKLWAVLNRQGASPGPEEGIAP